MDTSVHVFFDDQIFSLHTHGGISRYFVEMMRAFRGQSELGVQVTDRRMWTKNHYLVGSGLGRRTPWPPRLATALIRTLNRFTRRPGSADIVHHTYYDPRYLKRFRGSGLRVITVHDMIPELFPGLFPKGNPHLAKREYVDAADLVLCVSDSTRRDLIRIYGEPAVPSVVTPLAVGGEFEPGHARPGVLPKRYVLFVGSRSGYKDFDVLADAYAKAEIPPEVILVAIGGGRFKPEEKSRLRALGISRRALQLDLDDAELRGTYANAECFVFPSRYEGFGLPTLEAMASGCPVILAESSSHIEVGGKAALFFAPGEAPELARMLGSLVGNEELKLRMGALGHAQKTKFSWEKTARMTADAYHELVAGAS